MLSSSTSAAMDGVNRVPIDYSLKSIPIPSKAAYKKVLISKIEHLLKRMRWKAFYFLKHMPNEEDEDDADDEKFGFRTRRCPPVIEELKPFESDLLRLAIF